MKRKTHFSFKQFTLQHDRCTMKVGTDAVLLGAWANVSGVRRILDIGTGSGVIALMLAQRTPEDVRIDAVETSESDACQAAENVIQSPWPNKIKVINLAVQEYSPAEKFDLVISNPPFFHRSQEPPDKRRHRARHTAALDHESLLASACRLLSDEGKLNLILPNVEGNSFILHALDHNLFCTRKHSFRTRAEKPIERWLLEFSRRHGATETGEVLHYDQGSGWSDQYVALTKDFYLKL